MVESWIVLNMDYGSLRRPTNPSSCLKGNIDFQFYQYSTACLLAGEEVAFQNIGREGRTREIDVQLQKPWPNK